MVFLSSRIPPVTRENGADQAFRRERAQNALFIYASPLVVKKTFITFMLSGRSSGIREQGQGQEPGVGILKHEHRRQILHRLVRASPFWRQRSRNAPPPP